MSLHRAAAAAAIGLAIALPGPSQAAPPEVCQHYANEATAQHALNRERSCGFAGDPWSDNWNGHFNWCLGVSEEAVRGAGFVRQNELNRCQTCINYAAEATSQQQENVNNQCGYTGDPWSFHRDNHFRWCMGAPLASVNQATDFRRAEIGKCHGCRNYAPRAVEAFNATRVCGYQGDFWSPDFAAHFRWCTSVPASTAWSGDAVRTGEVAKCSNCIAYARAATQAQEQNMAEECGFGGDVWSANEPGHLNWCLGAPPGSAESWTRHRQWALQKCTGECRPYVMDAISAQDENERLGCDLQGAMWSKDPRHHANWCVAVHRDKREAGAEARRALLVQCIIPGRKKACDAYASTAVAQHEENRRLGCNRTGDPWSLNRANHFSWCLQVSPTTSNEATKQRERDLENCRRAMGQAPPPQCTVSVILRTKTCTNGTDGTPLENLAPGSTTGVGCGPDEETAEAAAKVGLALQVALSEGDDPAPGHCTYEREGVFPGCLCDR